MREPRQVGRGQYWPASIGNLKEKMIIQRSVSLWETVDFLKPQSEKFKKVGVFKGLSIFFEGLKIGTQSANFGL